MSTTIIEAALLPSPSTITATTKASSAKTEQPSNKPPSSATAADLKQHQNQDHVTINQSSASRPANSYHPPNEEADQDFPEAKRKTGDNYGGFGTGMNDNDVQATNCDNEQNDRLMPSEFVVSFKGNFRLCPSRQCRHRGRRRRRRWKGKHAAGVKWIHYTVLGDVEPGVRELLVQCKSFTGCSCHCYDHHRHCKSPSRTDHKLEFKVLASLDPGNMYYSLEIQGASGGKDEFPGSKVNGQLRYGFHLKVLRESQARHHARYGWARCKLAAPLGIYDDKDDIRAASSNDGGENVISFRFCSCDIRPPNSAGSLSGSTSSSAARTTVLRIQRGSSWLLLNDTTTGQNMPNLASSNEQPARVSTIHLVASICLAHLHASQTTTPKASGSGPQRNLLAGQPLSPEPTSLATSSSSSITTTSRSDSSGSLSPAVSPGSGAPCWLTDSSLARVRGRGRDRKRRKRRMSGGCQRPQDRACSNNNMQGSFSSSSMSYEFSPSPASSTSGSSTPSCSSYSTSARTKQSNSSGSRLSSFPLPSSSSSSSSLSCSPWSSVCSSLQCSCSPTCQAKRTPGGSHLSGCACSSTESLHSGANNSNQNQLDSNNPRAAKTRINPPSKQPCDPTTASASATTTSGGRVMQQTAGSGCPPGCWSSWRCHHHNQYSKIGDGYRRHFRRRKQRRNLNKATADTGESRRGCAARDVQTQADLGPLDGATKTAAASEAGIAIHHEKQQQQLHGLNRLSFKCPNCRVKLRGNSTAALISDTCDSLSAVTQPPIKDDEGQQQQQQQQRNDLSPKYLRVEGPWQKVLNEGGEKKLDQAREQRTNNCSRDQQNRQVPTQLVSNDETLNNDSSGPTMATKSLLSPMDFVWRGLSEGRALSCTEASLSGDSSSIVAQLAAAARSKSLCTESQPQLKWLAAHPGTVGLPKKILNNLGEKVGRLTRSAINHIKLLSASNPSIVRDANANNVVVVVGGDGPGEGDSSKQWEQGIGDDCRGQVKGKEFKTSPGGGNGTYWMRRRASSQRHHRGQYLGPNTKPSLEEMIVPHKLNRFTSASAANLGRLAPRTTSSSAATGAADDDDELFYSPDGVYLGPGGICSWREICNKAPQPPRGSLRPVAGGGAVSWLSRPLRSSLAQALTGSGGHGHEMATATTSNKRCKPPLQPPPVIVHWVPGAEDCDQFHRHHQCASDMAAGRSSSIAAIGYSGDGGGIKSPLGLTGNTCNSEQTNKRFQYPYQFGTSNRQLILGPTPADNNKTNSYSDRATEASFQYHQARDTTGNSCQVMTTNAKPNGVILYEPTPLTGNHDNDDNYKNSVAAAIIGGGGNSKQLAITKKPWILNLTQRYHHSGPKASPPQSHRGSQKKRHHERDRLAACESSKLASELATARQKGLPLLAKGARSNSLSGLYQISRLVELSRSSMELNECPSSQMIAEQTSLYLAELNSRFSGSTHELTPPPQAAASIMPMKPTSDSGGGANWFRRSSSSSTRYDANHDDAAEHHHQKQQSPAMQDHHHAPSTQAYFGGGGGDEKMEKQAQAAQPEPELYGANLQSICVHCQLIAELANHPASPYLSQLLVQTPAPSLRGQDLVGLGQEQQQHQQPLPVPVRPSVVLTVWSNQGTVDDDEDDGDGDDVDGDIDNDDGENQDGSSSEDADASQLASPGFSLPTIPSSSGHDRYDPIRLNKSDGRHRHRHHHHRNRRSLQHKGDHRQHHHHAKMTNKNNSNPGGRTHRRRRHHHPSGKSSSSASLNSLYEDDNDDHHNRRHDGGSKSSSSSSSSSASSSEPESGSNSLTFASSSMSRSRLQEASQGVATEATSFVVVAAPDSSGDDVEEDELDGGSENETSPTNWPPQPPPAGSNDIIINNGPAANKGEQELPLARQRRRRQKRSRRHLPASNDNIAEDEHDGANAAESPGAKAKRSNGCGARTKPRLHDERTPILNSARAELDKSGGKGGGKSRRRHHRQRSGRQQPEEEDAGEAAGEEQEEQEEDEDVDVEDDEEDAEVGGGNPYNNCSLLMVPQQANKQARSASLDAPYLLKVPERQEVLGENVYDESYPGKSNRSRSVDISFPTKPGEAYLVRQMAAAAASDTSAGAAAEAASAAAMNEDTHQAPLKTKRRLSFTPYEAELIGGAHQFREKKFIQGEIKVACANGETRTLKLFVDWQDDCINGEHLWIYAGSSSEACYVGENECLKHGPRLCCSACKITAHTSCISILIHKIKFICKHTFKDLTVNNPRHIKELQQHNVIYHHWIHKRTHCGRCKQCTKTFGNTKLPFSSKEIQAITCSWCKVSYHNKENCYTLSALTEPCTLGAHRESIIPPTWILKLPPATNSHQQQQHLASGVVGNLNVDGGVQGREANLQPENLIDLSITNQAFKTGCDNKENSENSRIHQHHHSSQTTMMNRNTNQQCPNYGSNTTLMTDTSGYISTDCSNVQSIMSGNQCNKLTCDNFQESKTGPSPIYSRSATNCSEIIIEPSALGLVDLNNINRRQYQQPKHPQESTTQFQKHQLKQHYQQLDANQNVEQLKASDNHDNEDTSMFIDLQQKPANHQTSEGLYRNFRIIPQPVQGIPNAGSKPVLVFVNPRSGGNQGAKMMQKFNWLLNPRQVFDLIQSNGPRAALELYRNVPNLRILTIGGDGTASWILSNLDEVELSNRIPVAVLPLGTGNDLARALGWGSGYADEPIAKVLMQVRDGEVVQLDRWNLQVERNYEVTPSSPNEFSSNGGINYTGVSMNMEVSPPSISSSPSYFGSFSQSNTNTASTLSIIDQTNYDTNVIQASGFSAPLDEAGNDRLPMDVINNYFSFGVDAHIALEFHTAREAHPERFNSRLKNRMFYGQAGGKDLLKRKWKDLSNFVTLYCDGFDMTSRLKELKVHSVLFLNIPSYGGGTRPWPTTATSFAKPRTDDGLIEVIGLTTYQLPLLQAGGHGTCIAQCRNAKIITSRTIPMQVDGEPCKLLPSIINISFKNRVCMLAKSKSSNKSNNMTTINNQKNN